MDLVTADPFFNLSRPELADPHVGPTVPRAKLGFERAEGTGPVLNSLVCSEATICGGDRAGL